MDASHGNGHTFDLAAQERAADRLVRAALVKSAIVATRTYLCESALAKHARKIGGMCRER
jgi:hypothetical protein